MAHRQGRAERIRLNSPLRLRWPNARRSDPSKEPQWTGCARYCGADPGSRASVSGSSAAAVLIASVAGFLYLVITANGLVDLQGRPLGTDFSNVYAAGTYVLEGSPAAPFDLALQHAREQQIFGAATPFYGWHYPPLFLFVAAALALLPYPIALAVWQAVTLGLYLLAIRAILSASPILSPHAGRGDWLLLALAFPAVLINVGHGQNGFLTAALLGAALVQLDRRPVVAGILFGLLAYKPQFGMMIPIALIAGGRWRCFATAVVAVAVLAITTTIAFGPHVWQAFFNFDPLHPSRRARTGRHRLVQDPKPVRLGAHVGASVPIAYALQGALVVTLGAALVWLWRSAAPYPLKAAALCLAAMLATPYTFDYDMMALAPAIAFLVADGLARDFGPWEKTALAGLWLMPLVARTVAHATLVPLGVPAMLVMFILLLRRSTVLVISPVAFSSAFLLK